jgi:pimeloyl-ACP methyl ester carboxylesterase
MVYNLVTNNISKDGEKQFAKRGRWIMASIFGVLTKWNPNYNSNKLHHIMKKGICFLILCQMLLNLNASFAQLPVSPNGKFVELKGCKIYYEEYGQGEPLFLLHGFTGTGEHWKSFVPEYAKNYRVIVWDMRGHGRSTNADTSINFLHATAARDLLSLMDKLKLNKVKAIGHSSGGMTILYAAIMAPDRFDAIVPVSAQIYYSKQVREFLEKNAKPIIPNPDLDRSHGKDKGAFLARQFYNFRKLYGDPALTPDQLGTIKARTLVVHGDNDFVPVSQAWEMFQNIPNAHIWISPNTSHGPPFGPNESDFIRRTLEFLKGDGWSKGLGW